MQKTSVFSTSTHNGNTMSHITINGQALPFSSGETILDVARRTGIDVPTLCWYPKLTTVGNCRVCLVSVAGQ
ncbi:MAG: 2Fe-2S iron-sulfur cluster-binding protein [Gemmatimonadales bacterium]